MSAELLPCPFCGAFASDDRDGDHSTAWEIGCSNMGCYAEPRVWAKEGRDEAIAKWNTRATPPPQPSVSEGSVSADIEWTDTRDGDAPLVKLAAMLQALEMEPAAVNLSAQQLAVICRGITKVAKRASAQPSVSEGSVPNGFVLVPKEPTPEMDAAGKRALSDNGVDNVDTSDALLTYKAMLAAAPRLTETQHTTKKG